MFVLMGAILERSGIAERLFKVMQIWMARLPGGLAVATIAMGAVFAAAAGVVGAVEVMIGMMAIPAMQRGGYRNSQIAGTICAGGSLGTMIPPSVIAVMYASLAQMSVGELLAGMMLPGLLMVGLFIIYLMIQGVLAPPQPAADVNEPEIALAEKLRITVTSLLPICALIFAVLGSLLAGIASPTEAASVGAVGALLLSIFYGRFNLSMLFDSLRITVRISAMILLIVAAGTMFMGTFAANGGSRMIRSFIEAAGFGDVGMIVFFPADRPASGLRARLDRQCAHCGADVHAVHSLCRDRSGLVRHHDDHCYPDQLPHAADGILDLLSQVHRPAGHDLWPDVPRGGAVHRAADRDIAGGGSVSRAGDMASLADRWLLEPFY